MIEYRYIIIFERFSLKIKSVLIKGHEEKMAGREAEKVQRQARHPEGEKEGPVHLLFISHKL